jgi:thioredoxin 1
MSTDALTANNFDSAINDATKPVLVDFWAAWCGPCRAMGPVVEDVSNELADKMDVYKCNVDNDPDIAQRYRIVSIPTLILFKNGEPVYTTVGSTSKSTLMRELEPYL